jgi:alpha-N-acetylglucosamine transferase
VENIKKCLEESYQLVLMISKHSKHLQKIETLALDVLSKKELEKVQFIHPDKVVDYLIGIKQQIEPKTEIIKGYRVTTDYDSSTTMDAKNIKQTLLKMMMKSRK